ncbi:helix-turn-helix domain-containing protein [Jeotgalibacillus malaysiensis]|uniref:helix-turn-helix domain-containing protein n=1 Tax=Jeotgalibacillus malaysiensis TaxID=1508404 RepID=UPI00384D0EA4
MNYLDAIVLAGLDIINGERTQSSIYHLLKGKKTSQTIQDAQLYGISPLFQLYRSMKRSYYDQRIEFLKHHGMIDEQEELKFRLTAKGRIELAEFFSVHPFPVYLNGWKYHQVTHLFWKRLTLSVQTGSNLIYSQHQFIPVTRDFYVQQWVKKMISENRNRLKDYTSQLNKELTVLFERDDFPDSPDLIVQQLSGYNQIGQTNRQLADQLNCGPDEIFTRFINELHYMFRVIDDDKTCFPLLSEMMDTQEIKSIPFTRSTEETYQYVKRNLSIDQIASVRRLKRSTIEDHILEIALLDQQFSIHSFVTEQLAEEIRTFKGRSNRLKYIKEHVPEADYFQIRLVLAKAERGELIWKNYLKKSLGITHSEQDKKRSSEQY